MERTPNKSLHTKSTLEKKILPPLLQGFELATFRSRVRRSNQQAIGELRFTDRKSELSNRSGGRKNGVSRLRVLIG